MRIDVSVLPAMAAAFLLVFARIGTMVMLLPGFGELTVPVRVRLTVALALAALLLPLHRHAYQLDLRAFGPVLLMLGTEMLIGVMLGMTARLAMSAVQVAGAVIAHQLGLSFAVAVDPTHGEHGALIGNFLSVLAVTLIFATDLHHLVIGALHDSYTLFAPGTIPLWGDIAALTTQTIAAAFKIGVQLAAPFLVFGLLFNIGLGVLSRLMPQMQVYFVGMPLSIWLGLLILFMVLGALMTAFLGSVEDVLRQLAPNI
jgi:flagellar biosynthetic protein FliR